MHAFDPRTIAEIQNKVINQGGRNAVSRLFYAGNDKETIAAWNSELNRILVVFNVRSVRSYLVVVNCSSSDRVDYEYPYHSCRHTPERIKNSRGC
jgi:hypothetical protein